MKRWAAVIAVLIAAAALGGCAIVPGDEGVRLEYSTHGVNALGPGDKLTIDIKVVDATSGLPLIGHPITATATNGALNHPSLTSPATFVFQVDRDATAPYTVRLSADAATGGDTVTLAYAAGYRFDEVFVKAAIDDGLIEISEYWNGYVCGDPFRENWSVWQTVNETDVQHRYGLDLEPSLIDERPTEFGGVLMIEGNPAVRDGEPPFVLWLDYAVESPFAPATQRVPVPVQPISDADCR